MRTPGIRSEVDAATAALPWLPETPNMEITIVCDSLASEGAMLLAFLFKMLHVLMEIVVTPSF